MKTKVKKSKTKDLRKWYDREAVTEDKVRESEETMNEDEVITWNEDDWETMRRQRQAKQKTYANDMTVKSSQFHASLR